VRSPVGLNVVLKIDALSYGFTRCAVRFGRDLKGRDVLRGRPGKAEVNGLVVGAFSVL
jgi:hypothetical protein